MNRMTATAQSLLLRRDAGSAEAPSMTAATDQLHIGNRWLGHSGLNMYDNTARLHDPILMRFGSPDPLFGKYPDTSPWTHCTANPLNAIDPTGMSSIFSPLGEFLGVDEEGFEGEIIVMEKDRYDENSKNTVISSSLAKKYSLPIDQLPRSVFNKIMYQVSNVLPNRPDYDGIITLGEANSWYRGKSGKPLFADLSKLDLSDLTKDDFKNGVCSFNLLGFSRIFSTPPLFVQIYSCIPRPQALDTRRFSEGLVYGNITLRLNDNNIVTAFNDIYDFDIKSWSNVTSIIRNLQTLVGGNVAGDGRPFTIQFFGSQKL